jgi:DNA-binding NarL/FixJ family response regulator
MIDGMHTVLVVDDHVGFRRYARVFLDASGLDVIGEAPDGASAIAESRRLRPSVVLLDVQLPDIDGFEVARRLLTEPDGPAIILISTRDAADYGDRIRTSGARGFVTKSRLTASAVLELIE